MNKTHLLLFPNISNLFLKNNKTAYEQMIINSSENESYKGIYLCECEPSEIEEFIIYLFWDKLNKLPIAQNVLITSKETCEEEIEAFLHRAILCNSNSLFVVEMSESFSEQQQSIMNTYIDQLLTYKKRNIKCDRKNTQDYMDSCIVFIYGKEKKR